MYPPVRGYLPWKSARLRSAAARMPALRSSESNGPAAWSASQASQASRLAPVGSVDGLLGRLHGERAIRGDLRRQLGDPRLDLACRVHVIHESDAQRLGRVEAREAFLQVREVVPDLGQRHAGRALEGGTEGRARLDVEARAEGPARALEDDDAHARGAVHGVGGLANSFPDLEVEGVQPLRLVQRDGGHGCLDLDLHLARHDSSSYFLNLRIPLPLRGESRVRGVEPCRLARSSS